MLHNHLDITEKNSSVCLGQNVCMPMINDEAEAHFSAGINCLWDKGKYATPNIRAVSYSSALHEVLPLSIPSKALKMSVRQKLFYRYANNNKHAF